MILLLALVLQDVEVKRDVAYGPDERHRLDLYLPKAEGPRPLIVCVHGGGWAGGDKARYQWMGEAFARQRFAAASVTYRFSPKVRAPAQMEDVQRAVRWLRKNAEDLKADPERFGAIGGSAGGHLASWLALSDAVDASDPTSAKVSAVVDCYGPVDLETMMRSASAPIVESFLGLPLAGNEEAYRRMSPHFLVKKDPPPFLVVHGTADVGDKRGQVPMEQSTAFVEKLKAAGGDARLLKLEGAPHGFTANGASPHAQETLAAALEFFARHLGKKP